MIEWGMVFALGFFSAVLFGVLSLPGMWRRALIAARRQIEASSPITAAEVAADKDQLRADFAIRASKLQTQLEDQKAKASSRLIEIGKRDEAVQSMRAQVLAQKRAMVELKEQIDAHKQTIRRLDGELKEGADKAARQAAASADDVIPAAVPGSNSDLEELATLADAQRIEIAALKTKIESLRSELEERGIDRSVLEAIDLAPAEDETALAEAERTALENRIKALNEDVRDAANTARKAESAMLDLESDLAAAETQQRALRTEIAALKATRAATEGLENGAGLRDMLNDLATEVARVAIRLDEAGDIRALTRQTIDRIEADAAKGKPVTPLAERIRALQGELAESGPA